MPFSFFSAMQSQGRKCDKIYISFTIFLHMALCNLADIKYSGKNILPSSLVQNEGG
jgi:hypothetical protein